MKKLLTLAATIAAMSFSAQAGYWNYELANYLDSNGKVVGTFHSPCFNLPDRITGTVTSNKVTVEIGTCQQLVA